jgi:hypothetical protein
VKSAISNGIAGSPMPAWSQANGGPLSEVEINDLTAFVLVLPGNSQVTQVVPATQTPAELNPWLTGWGGLALAVFVFLLLVGIILWSQSRRKA